MLTEMTLGGAIGGRVGGEECRLSALLLALRTCKAAETAGQARRRIQTVSICAEDGDGSRVEASTRVNQVHLLTCVRV